MQVGIGRQLKEFLNIPETVKIGFMAHVSAWLQGLVGGLGRNENPVRLPLRARSQQAALCCAAGGARRHRAYCGAGLGELCALMGCS